MFYTLGLLLFWLCGIVGGVSLVRSLFRPARPRGAAAVARRPAPRPVLRHPLLERPMPVQPVPLASRRPLPVRQARPLPLAA